MTRGNPLGNRVLVKPIDVDDTSPSGLIIIPDIAKQVPELGTVVAVGPGRTVVQGTQVVTIPTGLKVGDKILFSKYSGITIKLDGDEHIVMNEDDVLMTVNEGKPSVVGERPPAHP